MLWRLYSQMIKANGCEQSLTNLTEAFETKNYDKVEECLKIEDTKVIEALEEMFSEIQISTDYQEVLKNSEEKGEAFTITTNDIKLIINKIENLYSKAIKLATEGEKWDKFE